MATTFAYSEEHAVATLRLDRPERLNALTFDTYRELTETLRSLAGRDDIRVVVITGTGRAFCSGGDVEDIIGKLLNRSAAELLDFTRLTCDLIRAMRALPQPIVASLNGTVAGAGAAIAIASDLRIASEAARIAFLFVKVGLSGADMGAALLLPRLIGLGRATELLMTGEFLDAREAERIGLYNRVVPHDDLPAATDELVERLVRGPSEGLAITKQSLNLELTADLEAALEHEARVQAELMARPDFQEGFDAFMKRRPPRFRGGPE